MFLYRCHFFNILRHTYTSTLLGIFSWTKPTKGHSFFLQRIRTPYLLSFNFILIFFFWRYKRPGAQRPRFWCRGRQWIKLLLGSTSGAALPGNTAGSCIRLTDWSPTVPRLPCSPKRIQKRRGFYPRPRRYAGTCTDSHDKRFCMVLHLRFIWTFFLFCFVLHRWFCGMRHGRLCAYARCTCASCTPRNTTRITTHSWISADFGCTHR